MEQLLNVPETPAGENRLHLSHHMSPTFVSRSRVNYDDERRSTKSVVDTQFNMAAIGAHETFA